MRKKDKRDKRVKTDIIDLKKLLYIMQSTL